MRTRTLLPYPHCVPRLPTRLFGSRIAGRCTVLHTMRFACWLFVALLGRTYVTRFPHLTVATPTFTFTRYLATYRRYAVGYTDAH